MKKIMAAALALALMPAATAQNTTKLTADKSNEYGIVFSLPVTHLKIEIQAQCTQRIAGPYFQYAKKYLGVSDVITEDSRTWDVTAVYVTPFGEPDTTKYLMKFKPGSNPFVTLNKQGVPLAINADVDTEISEIPERVLPPDSKPSILADDAYLKSLPGELLVSESTAKKAEIAASLIYKIRESRTNLITGEADQMPPDGAALKLTMEHLDKQEEALTALFLGTTTTTNVIKSVEYCPGKDVTNEVIARISNLNGIVDKTDLSGAPLYLSLRVVERATLPVNEKGETKKLPKDAVVYNIPGKAQVVIKFRGNTMFDDKFEMSQYGVTFGADPALFTDKKAPCYLIYRPETGSVLELRSLTE